VPRSRAAAGDGAPYHRVHMSEENDEESSEPIAYVVSQGRIADFLIGFTLPVIAMPGRSIFRVLLHGSGFVQELEGLPPRIGFYVTYFVASRDVRSAEATTHKRLRDRWDTFYADDARGELTIATEEIERVEERFLARSRLGMSFYSSDD
jgi:hypothetical protein